MRTRNILTTRDLAGTRNFLRERPERAEDPGLLSKYHFYHCAARQSERARRNISAGGARGGFVTAKIHAERQSERMGVEQTRAAALHGGR